MDVAKSRGRRAKNPLASIVALIGSVLVSPAIHAAGDDLGWKPNDARNYLDGREAAWFAYDHRGEGASRSSCVSCHTVLPYAMAQPALHKISTDKAQGTTEARLLAQTRMRVANWSELDTDEFGLYYNDTERKRQQSWSTEAVLNAAILAFDDRSQGLSSPSESTRQAFKHLWATQVRTGVNQGSWDWLDFNEPPWGDAAARYYGAALAAIALATVPGYSGPGLDADAEGGVVRLRSYLKNELPKQNLHNQVWGLWAAVGLEGILTPAERKSICDQLLACQQADGGWNLPSLGQWVRRDRAPQDTASDGYATGLILHVLQLAGMPKDDAQIARGLDFLRANQSATGAWPCLSLLKTRNSASNTGKFMSDAATAFAILALTD